MEEKQHVLVRVIGTLTIFIVGALNPEYYQICVLGLLAIISIQTSK